MKIIISEFLTFLIGGILIVFGIVLRRFLPQDHSAQALVSEEAISKAIDWLAKYIVLILIYASLLAMVAVTFIYS
jgi:hypothetical protein